MLAPLYALATLRSRSRSTFLLLPLDYIMLTAYTHREKICSKHVFRKSYAVSIGKADIMADLQEVIGRVIRRERQDRNLTIKELGDKAGISEIYVGEIERGQKYPSSKVLESIAQALEIDLAEFLELLADEIRSEREPQMTTSAIGFVLPSTPNQPRRMVVKRIVNMLDEGDVESIANFSEFLFSKHRTPQ
jgi:transcriptional regulator with XRE-family HTH domain